VFCQTLPDTAHASIQIVCPTPNQKITSPVTIIGIGDLFKAESLEKSQRPANGEKGVSIEIMDNSDHTLGGGKASLCRNSASKDSFEAEISYERPFCKGGKIIIRKFFPTKGFKPTKTVLASTSLQNLLRIPVLFTEEADTGKCPNLEFENYPVNEVYKGPIAEVNFKSRVGANKYHTKILEAVKRGPNFAGHYTIAQWGCGSSCGNFAVVDDVTGKIEVLNLDENCGGAHFCLNSRLVILGLACVENPGESYYEFKDGKLAPLCHW
jgi:hypothetical protein